MRSIVKYATVAVMAAVAFSVNAEGRKKPAEPFGGKAPIEEVSPRSMGMDESRLQLIDSAVWDAIGNHIIPGAVVSVVREDKIVYLKAFGNKSVVPDTARMTRDVMFDLASCSKCVGTTLAFMQLIEDGKVRLHDNVDRYIPGFRGWKPAGSADDEKEDITIEHLLTHSSGIDPYISVSSYIEKYGQDSPDSLVRFIARESGRNFRPGTDFMYSCLNFVTLQAILEKVTGERLCDYALNHIFRPLGLCHTHYMDLDFISEGKDAYGVSYDELKGLCAPTEVQADGKPLLGMVHDPLARLINSGNSGNAGIFSDATDMSVICAAIMNGGEFNGVRILSPATVKLKSSVPADIDPKVGRALGWDHNSSHSGPRGDLFSRENTICHTGYTGTSVTMDLDSRTALIILAHRVHPEDKGSVGRLRAVLANIVAGAVTD